MGIGASIFLIAVGAILAFAVHATISGVSVQTVGVILMVVGVIGLNRTMLIGAPRAALGGVVEERDYDERPVAY